MPRHSDRLRRLRFRFCRLKVGLLCEVFFLSQVLSFKWPLLGVFAFFAFLCMYTASYVTPDPRMPQVFSSKDNYERFLPTLAKRYEQKFNPYRLKVRIVVGVNATDPIDRGTTPDYNDCFFNCAGQKPNYVDIFASSDLVDLACPFSMKFKQQCRAFFAKVSMEV